MSKVNFISVSEFKAQANVNSFEVKRNPKTSKLFVALPGGGTMRCQQEFDAEKPVQFIVEEGADIMDACLINYDASKGAPTIASF